MPIWVETPLLLAGHAALFAPLLLTALAIRHGDGPAPGWLVVPVSVGFGSAVYATAGAALGWWGWPLAWLALPAALAGCALFTLDEEPGHRWSAGLLATGWTLLGIQVGFVLGHAVGAPLTGWRTWGAFVLFAALVAGTLLLRHGIPASARVAGLLLALLLVAAAGWSPLSVGDGGTPLGLLVGVGWVITAITVSLLARTFDPEPVDTADGS